MTAIYKREMRGFLVTPTGYVFLALFYAISGYYFFGYLLFSGSSDFRPLFSTLFSFVTFITPLLTMRLFSEEKKYRTDQRLLTAPVSLTAIVGGKFLAAVTMFAAAQGVTLLYLLIISTMGQVEVAVFFGSFLGLFLMGTALCALGMFISALTESQVIAAVGTLGAGMLFMMIDSIGNAVQTPFLQTATRYLSFFTHYQDFTTGILNLADVLFFLSVAALFYFLTVRILEKRRWS